jgi:hypothetical protein
VSSRRHISGAHVPVRLGVGLAVCAAVSTLFLGGDVVMGVTAWHRFFFPVVSFALAGLAAWYGIYGVIRYGLFTEGCGAEEVKEELHLARIAYIAGGIAQVTLLVTLVLTIALIVQLVT